MVPLPAPYDPLPPPPRTGTSIPAFPAGFEFGTATSSHQIEGARVGRGQNIWDSFARLPGRVERGETGDVACEHVARYREDVQLMASLGLHCYRLSLSWPRLLPRGRGELNAEGVVFYRNLLTALREAGISTYVTLYHWDLPQDLEDEGGWRNRSTVEAFARYVSLAVERLGDLVDAWIPINEPACIAWLGHDTGLHAPGLRDTRAALRVAHHLNLAHGLAVQRLRDKGARRIGTALNLQVNLPAQDTRAHREAARLADLVHNEIWLGPLVDGRYSEELIELARPSSGAWDWVRPGDTEIAATPLDFTGINYYFPRLLAPRGPDSPSLAGRWQDIAGDEVASPTDAPRTEMGWWVEPRGLGRLLRTAHERTGLPLVVTENGTATNEPPAVLDPARQLDDVDRVRYLHDHLAEVALAGADGIPVQAYCAWSLLDNFEWACGYRPRFGLVHVDFGTGHRTPKRSARWYADLARTRRLPADPPPYRDFVAHRGDGGPTP